MSWGPRDERSGWPKWALWLCLFYVLVFGPGMIAYEIVNAVI